MGGRTLAALGAVLALAGPAAAAGDVSPGARQVACPRGAMREMPESSRVACWSMDPAALRTALRRSAATGAPMRFDLLRGVHASVPMTRDDGTSAWFGNAGDTNVVLVADTQLIGDVWLDNETYAIRGLDATTYVVGKVWRYGPHHADEPTAAPMTARPVIERPRAAAAKPKARPAPAPTLAPATPPIASTPPAVAQTRRPDATTDRGPLVVLAALLCAASAAAVSARRSAGSRRPAQRPHH